MNINILCALYAEAKPLLEKLTLQEQPGHKPFRLFKNERVTLLISGMGKTNMASACGYLYAQDPTVQCWINTGIAGHQHAAIGELFVAHKISQADNTQAWFPPQVVKHKLPVYEIKTVAKPETDYADGCAYDMEATAFYESASRFASSELVQCLKVVSDNYDTPIHNLNKNRVEKLIRQQIDAITLFIDQLMALADQLAMPSAIEIEPFLTQWHFSHTQQTQLRSCLERLNVIEDTEFELTGLTDSRAVLRYLQQRINNARVSFA